LPQAGTTLPLEIDHIRARKHHGATMIRNTCLACAYRNSAKGTNAAGYDPDTGNLVPLFNPRLHAWEDHFTWNGPMLLGTSSNARATIKVLRINDPARIAHRRLLIIAGQFGPP
jgi:hypothetical protein